MIFLVLSWLILFNGLEESSIDEATFFTSLLIYTGAIVFDLIFLCIETYAENNITTEGVYRGSLVLAVVNSILVIFEFIGAMRGIEIIADEKNKLVMKITDGGITRVFSVLNSFKFKVSFFMLLIVGLGVLLIIPGLLLTRIKRKYQENNQS